MDYNTYLDMEVLYPPRQLDPRITTIGTGAGTAAILNQLKQNTSNITAVVGTNSSNDSDRMLIERYGVTPPSNARSAIATLSNDPFRAAYSHTPHTRGRLKGHAPGSIYLAELERSYGSFEKAVDHYSEEMNIVGQVIPITRRHHPLVLRTDKKYVEGGKEIDKFVVTEPRLTKIGHQSRGYINCSAKNAILNSDVIVIAEGKLLSQQLAMLSFIGVGKAIRNSGAEVIYTAPSVHHKNHTAGWSLLDHINMIERYIGRDTIDTVLTDSDACAHRPMNASVISVGPKHAAAQAIMRIALRGERRLLRA